MEAGKRAARTATTADVPDLYDIPVRDMGVYQRVYGL